MDECFAFGHTAARVCEVFLNGKGRILKKMKDFDNVDRECCEVIEKRIETAEFVLIGVGKEFQSTGENKEKLLQAYAQLEKLIKGKPYFVVTENEDDVIFESELLDFFIAAPFADDSRMQSSEEQWNSYLNWLTATLNHSLCILELGVGFEAPQVIRWPFEKTVAFSLKSVLIRVNGKFPQLSKEISERGISVTQNALDLFSQWKD